MARYTLLKREYDSNSFAIFDYRDKDTWKCAVVRAIHTQNHLLHYGLAVFLPRNSADSYYETIEIKQWRLERLLAEPGSRVPRTWWNWVVILNYMATKTRVTIPESVFDFFGVKKCDLIILSFLYSHWELLNYIMSNISPDEIEMYTVREAVEKLQTSTPLIKIKTQFDDPEALMWQNFPELCIFFKSDEIYKYFLAACENSEALVHDLIRCLIFLDMDNRTRLDPLVVSRLLEENLLTEDLQHYFNNEQIKRERSKFKWKKYHVLVELKKSLASQDLINLVADYLPWFSVTTLGEAREMALRLEMETYTLQQENARLKYLLTAPN